MPTVNPEELQDLSTVAAASAEEGAEFTIRELWDHVQLEEDIIIEIDAVEESRVRKGPSGAKAKENQKLKDNDLPIDTSTLEFKRHDDPDIPKGRVKLQIWLKRPDKIKIHKLVKADGEL